MSDQELDDLFKEAASRYDPPEDTGAWQNMSSLLDQATPKSSTSWTVKTLSMVTLLVLFSDTGYVRSNAWNSATAEVTEPAVNTRSSTITAKAEGEPVNVSENRTEINKDGEGIENMKDNSIQHNVSKPGSLKRPQAGSEISYYNGADDPSAKKNDSITIVPLRQQPESYKNAYRPEQGNGDFRENKMAILQDSLADKKVVEEETKVNADSAKQDRKEEEKKATTPGRLSVKLAVSPDLTSVGYFSPGRVGLNYGVLAEYALTDHWSVTTGLLSSRKIYSDSEQQDNGYGSSMTRSIEGKCYMLDIPVNVQYYFTPGKKYSLYASAGLSSYIMNREDYTYTTTGSLNDYSYRKSVRNENSEWFRVMNISLGLQRQFSRRVYFQVEPFLKAPVADLGEARLRMVSTGAFVQLKYVLK